MSSRDGSGQSGNKRRPARADSPFAPSASQNAYDIDPAEIDRYLTGKPHRVSTPSQHTSQTGNQTTPDQLDRLRRMVETTDAPRSVPASRAGQSLTYREADASASHPSASRAKVSAGSATPYSNRPAYIEEVAHAEDYLDAYPGQWDEEGDPAIAGRTGARSRPRASMPAVPKLAIPRSITSAALLADRTAIVLIGLSVVSLIGMAVLVSNRLPALPPEIATHVSASGVLGNMAPRSVIWRIPLLAAMLTLMNLVIGAFAARFDRFASRLVLSAGLAVQFLAWVALLRIL